MDAGAQMKTYGNEDLPAGTPDRPLVTFALFAYNQEKYIREAVEGAFSQTYEPLEIILSDDCSSDRTFEIMKDMAERYEGPHRVIVRSSLVNSGILNHVLDVVAAARGTLIILAAGDDISYPQRAQMTANAWLESGAWGLFGNSDIIEQGGEIIEFNNCPRSNTEIAKWIFSLGKEIFVHGATSAYDYRLFDYLKRSKVPILSEDTVFTSAIYLIGKECKHIDTPLIKYRRHSAAVSNGTSLERGFSGVFENELKLAKYAKTVPPMCDYIKSTFLTTEESKGRLEIISDDISATKEYYELRALWIECTFSQRLRLVFSTKQPRSRSFLLPRLAGLKIFVILKTIFRRPRWLQ